MRQHIEPEDFKSGIIVFTEETLERFRQHQNVLDNKAYQTENHKEACTKLQMIQGPSMNRVSVLNLATNSNCGNP